MRFHISRNVGAPPFAVAAATEGWEAKMLTFDRITAY